MKVIPISRFRQVFPFLAGHSGRPGSARLLVLSVLMLVPGLLHAQPLDFLKADTTNRGKIYPRYLVFDFKMQYGRHITTGVPILEQTIEQNPYHVAEFRLGVRGYGFRRWQQIYRYPVYGIGIYQAWFIPQNNLLGNPTSAFIFFNPRLLGNEKFAFGLDLESGLSFNFLNYDPEKNPDQIAIGSALNIHFQMATEASFRVSRGLDASTGIGFTHFSNGRIRTPQRGVNLYHAYGRLRYNIPAIRGRNGTKKAWPPKRPEYIHHEIPKFKGRWEYYGVLSAGLATPEEIWDNRGIHYFVASLSLDLARHYYYFGKAGIGFDFFHDRSMQEKYRYIKTDPTLADMTFWGFHLSHEFMIQRFTLISQVGVTLAKRDLEGKWYGRFGMRIDLTRHLFLRGTLKIPDGFKADFIEWGLGCNLYSRGIGS